jgi:hypothetical protein
LAKDLLAIAVRDAGGIDWRVAGLSERRHASGVRRAADENIPI